MCRRHNESGTLFACLQRFAGTFGLGQIVHHAKYLPLVVRPVCRPPVVHNRAIFMKVAIVEIPGGISVHDHCRSLKGWVDIGWVNQWKIRMAYEFIGGIPPVTLACVAYPNKTSRFIN